VVLVGHSSLPWLTKQCWQQDNRGSNFGFITC
jgi:hypothetical protein